MKANWLIVPLAGLTAVVIYLSFSLVSFAYYPASYSPMTNWLSDLGNPQTSPSGAIFYRLGGIFTSGFLMAFFAGLYMWDSADSNMKILKTVGVVFGFFGSFAFISSSVFSLGVNDSMHSMFSTMLFIFFGFFEIFMASALRRSPMRVKTLPYFGFAIATINFMLGVSFIFTDFFFGEWIMIGLLISFIIVLATLQNARLAAQR
jgi:hypothetical protein